MKTKSLHFYTTGEGLTSLLLDFYQSGEFEKFEQILNDGNLDEEHALKAFSLQMSLTGTTKDGEDLQCHFSEKEPEDFNTTLYFAVLTAIRSKGRYNIPFFEISSMRLLEDKNIQTILKYFSLKDLYKRCWKDILLEEGFEVIPLLEAITRAEQTISGLVLDTGEFVKCGYQQHNELWPVLCQLGIVEGSAHLSSNTIAISSNLLVGSIAFNLQSGNYDLHEFSATDAQIRTLWSLKEYDLKHYSSRGDNRSINEEILRYSSFKTSLGGKFGNLTFLKEFYPEIKLVSFSRTPNKAWAKTIVRTSPNRSLPGLLNSIIVKDEKELKAAVEKIKLDFEKHKDVLGKNNINWFYQEFIPGKNGVVNCVEKTMDQYPRSKSLTQEYIATLKYDIEIACSTEQGAIVEGYMTNTEMNPDNATQLRRIARMLAEDFHTDLQLEFVITPEEEVIIVQLRLFENRPSKFNDISEDIAKRALVRGLSFSSPRHNNNIEVTIDELLIVEQDCKSEELIGKKALIVENNTSFSHILALSKAMNIPSMYGTGKVVLDGKSSFVFNTEHNTGYIK